MKKVLVAFLLLLATSAYSAEEKSRFTKLDEGKTGITYLVNGSLRSDGSLHSIWVKTDYTATGVQENIVKYPKFGARATYIMTQMLFNCDNDRYKLLSVNVYNKNGSIIYSEPMGEAMDIIPNSIAEAVQSVACYYYRNPEARTRRMSEKF